MKPIELVTEYLKQECKYSAVFPQGINLGVIYICQHEKVKGARFNGKYPDSPCTTDDWKVCPLNAEWTERMKKRRLSQEDYPEAYVCRCLLCDNDFTDEIATADICGACK